ncbi:TetR/AcrR family transcriptional regulator [Sphingobium sp. C100]|uniref:TetR/AcrR family transcriptional regulator n=1 Tax=Sphingobium sp. C100 TaxID=1207055 RepID=UPI000A054CA0|nr:TetR/AcrR family transcriptional regulator [Sphingobium sp. C100]
MIRSHVGFMRQKNVLSISSKRELKKSARRKNIVNVAMNAFLESGYDNVTMSDISSILGGSKSTLWQYFDHKEDIAVAAIELKVQLFRNFLDLDISECSSTTSMLNLSSKRFCHFLMRDDTIEIERIIIINNRRIPKLGNIFYSNTFLYFRDQVSLFLANSLYDEDPDDAAMLLLDLCTSGFNRRLILELRHANNILADQIADRAVQIFMKIYHKCLVRHHAD